mgnify:CR=1 FL=1
MARKIAATFSSSGLTGLHINLLDAPNPITINANLFAVQAIKRMDYNRHTAISLLPVVTGHGQINGLLRLLDLVQAGLA